MALCKRQRSDVFLLISVIVIDPLLDLVPFGFGVLKGLVLRMCMYFVRCVNRTSVTALEATVGLGWWKG